MNDLHFFQRGSLKSEIFEKVKEALYFAPQHLLTTKIIKAC